MPSSTACHDVLAPSDLEHVAGGLTPTPGPGAQLRAGAAMGSMLYRGGWNIYLEALKQNPITKWWATPWANSMEKVLHARPHDPAISF